MKPLELTDGLRARLKHVRVGEGPVDLARFPDFLLLGPQRTGTTWLSHHLGRHPRIMIPRQKETFYFTALGRPDHPRRRFDTLQDYLEVYREPWLRRVRKSARCLCACGEPYRPRLFGEATASYARLPGGIVEEIRALNPEIKAIVILRDPLERTLSHARKDLIRDPGKSAAEVGADAFKDFFRRAGQRQCANYKDIIATWRKHLKPGHLHLDEFARIAEAPRELLGGVHRFLGVPTGGRFLPGPALEKKINVTGDVPIPEEAVDFARDLLAEDRRDFLEVVEELRRNRT